MTTAVGGTDQARKLAFLAMGEKELRSLAGKALQGPIDNEDLLDPEPGTDSQLALAELGRRWQKWYIFKCMLPELTGLGTPARSVLRMTAEDVAAASQGGVDSVGVLAMVRYADMTRGTRRIWRGAMKRPLEAHLQVSGLAHVASTTPLGVLFGLEPRDLAADEDNYEVAPEIADMVHNWPCDPHRDHRLAEAREWVATAKDSLSRPLAPEHRNEKRMRSNDDSTTNDHAAKHTRLSGLSAEVHAQRPTHDPKYGPITYLSPEQAEQAAEYLLRKYSPTWRAPAPAPLAVVLQAQSPAPIVAHTLEAAASAVVGLMVGEDDCRNEPRQRALTPDEMQCDHETEDAKREMQDPNYRSYRIKTNLPMDKKPYEELETTYVSSNSKWKEAQEEATKRERLFVDIVGAMFEVARQYGVTGVSIQQAYLTKAPSMLQITLGDLIRQSVPPAVFDTAKLAVTQALHKKCGAKLFGATGATGSDQMLSAPLRALCGITTKIPHFEFVRGGVSRDSASTEDILSKISPSPLTNAIFGAILLA